jgi:hypothetical protein
MYSGLPTSSCLKPCLQTQAPSGNPINHLLYGFLLNIDKSSAIKAFGEFILKAITHCDSLKKAQHMVRCGINEASHYVASEKQSSP